MSERDVEDFDEDDIVMTTPSPYVDEEPQVEFTTLPSSSLENGSYVDPDDGLEMVPVTIRGWGGKQLEQENLPSNERLLCIAFVSFMGFAICQIIAAFIAGSEAMMGDSAAMVVDSLAYLFNLLAERMKNRFDENWEIVGQEMDPERMARVKARARRKMTLQLELVPPLVSVLVLIGVTTMVLNESIGLLVLDAHRKRSEQGDPNVTLMIIFSSLNLLLDVLNVFCFAKSKHLYGFITAPTPVVPGIGITNESKGTVAPRNYSHLNSSDAEDFNGDDTEEMEDIDDMEGTSLSERMRALKDEGPINDGDDMNGYSKAAEDGKMDQTKEENNDGSLQVPENNDDGLQVQENNEIKPQSSEAVNHEVVFESGNLGHELEDDDAADAADEQEEANLNMCSAYTHVIADTLRSIAVIVAAVIAEVSSAVTSEEADSAAAVTVSILILASLVPLFRGLWITFSELRAILAEEASEKMERMYARETTPEPEIAEV